MERGLQGKGKKTRNSSFAKSAKVYLLWAVVLTVCFFLLKILFEVFWKDRVDYARLDECQLVSYTAEQSFHTEELMKKDFRYIDEKMLINLGVSAGWGVLYGGFEWDEIQEILKSKMWDIDIFAVKDEDGFRLLTGDMTEDEFDTRSKEMYEDSQIQGEWLADSAIGIKYEIDEEEPDKCWVSCTFVNTGYEMLVRVSDDEFIEKMHESLEVNIKDLVEACSIPDNGGLICVSQSTGEVKAVKGDLKVSSGDVLTRIPDQNGFMTIGGDKCIAAESSNDQYRFIAAIPVGSSKWMRVFSASFVSIGFTLLLFLAILYAWFLREDILLGRTVNKLAGEKSLDPVKLFRGRMRLFFHTLGCLTTLLMILLISLSIIDHTRMRITGLLEDSYQYFVTTTENENMMEEVGSAARRKVAATINTMICRQPSLINNEALRDLGIALNGGIYVVNRNGAVAAGGAYWDQEVSSYDLSGLTEEDSPWEKLKKVLEGKADSQSTDINMNDTVMSVCGVQRQDAPGMVLYMSEKIRSYVSDSMFSGFPMTEGRILFAIDVNKNEIISCSDEKYIGTDSEQFGMTEESLKSGFAGPVLLSAGRYFVVTQQYSGILSCMGVSIRYIIKTYLLAVVLTLITGLIVTAFFLVLVLSIQMNRWPDSVTGANRSRRYRATVSINANDPAEDKPEEDGRFYDYETDGLLEQTSADERWNDLHTPFSQRYAEDKFKLVLHTVILLILIFVYWHPAFVSPGFHMMIEFLLNKGWPSGVNVYAISYCLLILATIAIAAGFIRRFVLVVGGNFGNRGVTIARLIDSFINYAVILGGIGYGLTFLGVDTTTILASVGIVGLGLSLGAKDLVTDILAGVGIVFEGEFRNGDIVEIGGYRGTVIDIGIRTTKVLSNNNVKIFRNSEVSGVINMTQRYSFAEVRIQVARSLPLEKVERIFQKELPLIQRRIPEMGEDIRMLGVVEMTADSITLSITANCNEKDRMKVVRRLYREINLMMAREGIPPRNLASAPTTSASSATANPAASSSAATAAASSASANPAASSAAPTASASSAPANPAVSAAAPTASVSSAEAVSSPSSEKRE